MLLLFLSVLLIVAFTLANHYQAKLNRRLKIEHDYRLLIQKQLYQLEDLRRSYRQLVAENKALRGQGFRVQQKQLLANLN